MVATTCRVIIPMKMIEVLSVELEILTPLMPHMIATCVVRYLFFFFVFGTLTFFTIRFMFMGLTYQVMFQQMPSYSGGQSARTLSGGLPGRSVDDPRMMGMGGVDPGAPVKDRVLGMGSGRPEAPLPPGATSTLFVEGLPPNCTRREVARILNFSRGFAVFFP